MIVDRAHHEKSCMLLGHLQFLFKYRQLVQQGLNAAP